MDYFLRALEDQKKHLLILALAVTFIFIFVDKIDYSLPEYADIDNLYYRTMADASPGLSSDVIHPFTYRIFGPWIAGIMPFHNDINFGILMYFSLIGLTFAFYKFLIFNEVNTNIALITSLWLVFNKYLFGIMGFSYFQLCDSISMTMLILSFIFLYKNNWTAIFICSIIGILSKETMLLFYLPAFIYLIVNKKSKAEFIKCIITGFLTFVIFVFIRQLLSPAGTENYITQISQGVSKLFNPVSWARQLSNAFIPFSLIFIIFIKEIFQFAKKHIYLVALFVLTLSSSLFGLDNERLVLPGILFIYLFFAKISEQYLVQKNKQMRWNLIIPITALALVSNLYHLWGLIRFPERSISLYFTIVIDVIILGTFVYVKYFDKQEKQTASVSELDY